MKKIASIIFASALAVTSLPFIYSGAGSAIAETDNLGSLASSLGADTDFFNFKNYTKNYLDTDIIVHECEDQSYGMAMIQILTHNGLFSVADVQKGAATLHDVNFNDEIERLVESYQLTRFNAPQVNSKRNYKDNDLKTLTETATESMEKGRYFHISLSMPEELQFDGKRYNRPAHDIAGIGISEGEWSFNEKTFDKCILTLDSNADGFNRDYCIYINSADNSFIIPAYEEEGDSVVIESVVSDDAIMNYNGSLGEQLELPSIPPPDDPKPDDPDDPAPNSPDNPIIPFEIDGSEMIDIEIGMGSRKIVQGEKYMEYQKTEHSFKLTAGENVYNAKGETKYYDYNMSYFRVPKSETYKFQYTDFDSENYRLYLRLNSAKLSNYAEAGDYADSAEISANSVRMKTRYNDEVTLGLCPENTLSDDFFDCFRVQVSDVTDISMTDRPDGILVHSETPYKGDLIFSHLRSDREIIESSERFRIEPSAGSVLFKYDHEAEKLRAFVDRDGDDVFETPVIYGDANLDGVPDAKDSSAILDVYATLSTHNSYPMDMINSFLDADENGRIDAADASYILSVYAENATK